MSALIAVAALIAVVGMTAPAWAQDETPAESAPAPEAVPAPETVPALEIAPTPEHAPERNGAVAAIDRAHGMISSGITETADRLDAFLGKPRALEESNRSYLKLGVLRVSDEDGMDIRREIKLKIVLPRLQERLHLIIEQDGERAGIDPESGTQLAEDLTTGTPSGDLTSAIRLMLRSARDLNIYIDGGVRVRRHPTVFSRIRYRQSAEFTYWVARFTQSVKWEEQFEENPHQWEVISRLDFDRPIPPKYFFRSSLQGAWYEGQHGYFVTQSFTVIHQISERPRAMLYQWSTLARTGQLVKTVNDTEIIVDPDDRFRIEETGFKIGYRQTVGWPWLFFEADAERAFRRDLGSEVDFDAFWRTILKLEVQFRHIDPQPGPRSFF